MSIKTNTTKSIANDCKPPESTKEGGFGYVVFVAVTVISINCSLLFASFGIVFGEFLSTLADETTGTSIANGISNTVSSFTGLAANYLLNSWSCRNVGLLGALVSSIGFFSLYFVNDLISFIVFYGIFQGFGYGLLFPASLTALNNFFNRKLTFMLSVSQALMVACTMVIPPLATIAMDIWGYRGSLLCLAGLSLINIPSSVVLSRISWDHKQMGGQEHKEINNSKNNSGSVKSKSSDDLSKDWTNLEKPLLQKQNSLKDVANAIPVEVKVSHIVGRTISAISLNKTVQNEICRNEEESVWGSILATVDFSLLRNVKYLNVSIGLALSYTSDICFITIIPLLLSEIGFSSSDVGLTMLVFFGCDLLSRILLSVVSAFYSPKSRYLVLWGTLLSAIFRIAFVCGHSFLWKAVILGILGFLRCFIQTPLPLVLSEEYPNQFATAFSVYMVVCGVVTLVSGPLMALIKSLTNSDIMVCHLLTSCYVICVISWMCEMVLDFRKKPERINEKPAYVV